MPRIQATAPNLAAEFKHTDTRAALAGVAGATTSGVQGHADETSSTPTSRQESPRFSESLARQSARHAPNEPKSKPAEKASAKERADKREDASDTAPEPENCVNGTPDADPRDENPDASGETIESNDTPDAQEVPHRPKAGDNDTPAQDPTLLAKPSMNGQPQSPQAITIQPETDQPPPPTNVQADQPAATSAESKIPVQVQGPTKPQGPMASESTVHMHPSADNASDDQHDLPDDGNSDDSQPQRFASPRSIPIRTLPDSRHDEPSPPQANLAPDRKSDSGANAASPSPSATVQMKAGREEPHRGTDAAPSAPNDNKADPVADRPAAQPTLKLVPTFEPVAPSIGAAKAQLSPTQSANPASPQADPASAAVARGLTAAISQKGGSLTIRLIPETLGLVRVHMEIASGRVTATLEATSAPAHELLNSNLGMLRSALESRGLSVDRLQVNLAAAPVQNENPTSFTASHDRDGGTSSFQHDAADGHSRGGEGGGHDRQFAGGQSGTSDSEWNNQEPDPRSFGARLRLTLDAVA